jgi:lysophospholipase L1-like esterase
LFAAAVAAGQKLTFTGSMSNGPTMVSGQTFPRRHEGHSGWGIARVTPFSGNSAGIATLIPNPAFSSASGGVPEIILLHIGTNDATNFTAAQMQTDLRGVLDKIFAGAPNALVVLARIIPIGYDVNNAVVRTYNQALPGIVQDVAATGKHIQLVDMNMGFSASMFASDNIHPNTSGYKLMAERWHAAIGPLLPK